MPPKRTATKTTEDKQTKEPIKRSTRSAKNKRELSDEEPIVDAKKKKITEKVPSKAPTSKAPVKRKQQSNSAEDDVEPKNVLEQTTKRKRVATSKETKSVKVKKDVNDNELVNESEPVDEDDEDDKPVSQPTKPATARGRARKTAAANLNTEAEKPSAQIQKRARGRSKKPVDEEQNVDEKQSDDEEETEQQVKEPARKVRAGKKQAVSEEDLPIVEETRKRSTRAKRTVEKHVVEEEVESQHVPKRGARAGSKKESETKDEDVAQTKKGAQNKSRTKVSKEDEETEDNVKPIAKRSGRAAINRQDSKSETEAADKQVAIKIIRSKKTAATTLEEEKEESIDDKQQEEEAQPELPAVKKSRGRAQKVPEDQPPPAVVRAHRRGRNAKKDDEIHSEDKQESEEHKAEEIVETLSQPTASTVEHPVGKRGRKPSRKIAENIELQTQSQPITSTTSIEPLKKKGRTKGKKPATHIDEQIEEVQEEVQEEDQNKLVLDEDEDDNASEKDLVIDLPEEPPKKQPRSKKTKEAVVQIAEKEIESQSTSKSDKQVLPPKRAARGKKQLDKEVPSTVTTSQTNKRKTEDIAESSSNENLLEDKKAEPTQSEQHVTQVDDEELNNKRPVKRGRHAAISVKPVVEVVSEKESVPEQSDEQIEKLSNEESTDQPTSSEVLATSNDDDKKSDQNESIQSSSLDSIKQNEIDNVIEFMKSIVEKSVREDASFEQSKVADEETSSSLEEIEAKELEETFAELPNASASSDDLRLTYDSVAFKNNFSKTESTNLISFTNTEHESNDRKRVKLFDIRDRLNLIKISNGTIVAFGDNEIGELGIGRITNGKSLPTQINAKDEFCYVNTLSQHSACINSKGELYTFGNNDECALGRLTILGANQDQDSSLAETNNDEVEENQRNQEQLESTPTICEIYKSYRVFKATCGDSHTAVLTTNGTVLYWGNFRDTNGSIGLGVNKLKASLEPELIDTELEIVDIASGGNFLLLLDSSGRVYSLGTCDVGQLGRLSNRDCKFNKQNRELYLKAHPIEFPKDVKIDAIWAGEFDAFARSTDNRIFAWGLNNYCQLGFKQEGSDSNEDQCVWKPKEVAHFTKLGHRIEKIACGQHHSIALDDRGNVFAFGRHEYGRLGLGKIDEDVTAPKMIETFKGNKVIDISCGASSSFATTESGKLYSWGMESRQLGQGKDPGDLLEPTIVNFKSIDNFKAIKVSAGSNHCLVLGQAAKDDEINNNAVKNGL